jgi:hypothetical protein
VDRALAALSCPIVLLKGTAYLAAQLPLSRGRVSSDVDLMVPRTFLEEAEESLKAHGYAFKPLRQMDERFYREWLHELPPLVHAHRQIEVDVHYGIVPRIDTLKVNFDLLFAASVPVSSSSRLRMLCPQDMFLHASTHLFRNGIYRRGLRDLLDMHDLLVQFSAMPGYWAKLLERAGMLDLRIPCFFAMRYVQALFATPIPDSVCEQVARWKPGLPPIGAIDWLVYRATLPQQINCPDHLRHWSILLLEHYPPRRLGVLLAPIYWMKRFEWFNKPVAA